MDLDDQLAALAAGDLDETTARALRARVAADPALAQRLARLQRLDELLAGWDAPGMDEAATRRLTARVDAALDDLDDGPLRRDEQSAGSPDALGATGASERIAGATDGASVADGAAVVDLGSERQRRRGIPTWAASAAVAAVLTIVVGIGVSPMFLGGGDSATTADQADTVAGQPESAETDSAGSDEEMADDAAGSAMAESETADGEAAQETAPVAVRLDGVDLAEGELARLVDEDPDDLGARRESTAAADGDTADEPDESVDAQGDPAARCATTAAERDAAGTGQVVVELVATGTYAAQDAVLVVLRQPTETGATLQVLAYAPEDCTVLDQTSVQR